MTERENDLIAQYRKEQAEKIWQRERVEHALISGVLNITVFIIIPAIIVCIVLMRGG